MLSGVEPSLAAVKMRQSYCNVTDSCRYVFRITGGFLYACEGFLFYRPSINYSSHDPIPLNTEIDSDGQTEAQNHSHESYPSNSKRATEIYVFFDFALCSIIANIGKY
jgi:hypothetical protein